MRRGAAIVCAKVIMKRTAALAWLAIVPPLTAVMLYTTSQFPSAQAQPASPADRDIEQQEAQAIARDAYQYAYPIVIMDVTMRQATNVPNATTTIMRAPVNQFAHVRSYPPGDAKDVVRINFDTLYSSAWVDVSREPIVLSVPDTNGRYYLLQMLDMWSDVFAVVGKRTTGTKAGSFALVAPGWTGTLPEGVRKIAAPTATFWILGRTQTNGPGDYDNVHKIQDGYTLTPLSDWGKSYRPKAAQTDPSIDEKTPPMVQVNRMDGGTMLKRLVRLMAKYPPHANDYPILFRMQRIGLEAGKDFNAAKLDPARAKDALADMERHLMTFGRRENGWQLQTENVGTYGTSYRQRATIALAGLGANLPEDAVYPTAFVDGDGQPLDGGHRYVLHFDKGVLPPVNAFWSVTLYGSDNYQVPNPINRFALGDRDKLAYNADGSLDLYIQNASPGPGKEANWLPAPKGAFNLTMRLYSPKQKVPDGAWAPPPVKRIDVATGTSTSPPTRQ